MVSTATTNALQEVAERIRELRILSGYTEEQMSEYTGVSLEEYLVYEAGETDLPFTFIHKCALTFGVEITDLLEGRKAEIIPTIYAHALPGGQVVKEDYLQLAKELVDKYGDQFTEDMVDQMMRNYGTPAE